MTHNVDITRAITAANTLKAKGSRIEIIAVGMPSDRVKVLQDNVVFVTSNGTGNLNIPDNQFANVTPTYQSRYQAAVDAGVLDYHVRSNGIDRYYFRRGG